MRVDVPKLQCDRCKTATTDLHEMGRYQTLTHYHMGGHDEWDLCLSCWSDYLQVFLGEEPK